MSSAAERIYLAPPRDGQIVVLTVDATSRRYDLGAVDLGGKPVREGGTVELTFISSAAFYFKFNDTNEGTVDETDADAAGSGPTFQADAAVLVPANTYVSCTVSRTKDRYFLVKGTAGTLRMWATSGRTVR